MEGELTIAPNLWFVRVCTT